MSDHFELCLHGHLENPALVYLPGLHGDCTLITGFRQAAMKSFLFAEICYSKATNLALEDYASAIESALLARKITQGWLLGESFGSQVAWALAAHAKQFRPLAIILAGGFVRHPWIPMVKLVSKANRAQPMWGVRSILKLYRPLAKFCQRHDPGAAASLDEFFRQRSDPLDREAIIHRYHLIVRHDWRPWALKAAIPVFCLAGFWDLIVPWPFVLWWLKRNCPGYRGSRIVFFADHPVLGNNARASIQQIEKWIGQTQRKDV